MNRILYICPVADTQKVGADIINERNLCILQQILGDKLYVYNISRTSRIRTFYELIRGNTGFLKQSDLRKIVEVIESQDISTVFLWSSRIGKIAKLLRKKFPHLNIITFFHNIEKQYFNEELSYHYSLKTALQKVVTCKNEAVACDFSDHLVTLNDRDSQLLHKYYHKTASTQLPTSFRDEYKADRKSAVRSRYPGDVLRLLFLGSSFFANIEGVRWFIDEVLPKIPDAHLTIAGRGMDSVFISAPNITVLGYVPEISDLYYSCDIVVSPILSGGGMKTKTCEALMYGMPVIGTTEAFVGYDIDYNKVGAKTDSAAEMADKINQLKDNPSLIDSMSDYARSVFLKKYETSILTEKLKQLLN